jgi:hypothetical protein
MPFQWQVEDQPPCIRRTSPGFTESPKIKQLFDQEQKFQVLEVADDGDPLPPPGHDSQSSFTWYIKREGEPDFRRLVNATYREHFIPARQYQPGDRIQVRVQYWDRLGLTDPAARSLGHCQAGQAVCAINKPGSTCYQWVTWEVEYL